MRSSRAVALLAPLLCSLAAACSTSFTVGEITEDFLGKTVFPAPKDELVLIRSKYIAAAIARYGAWRSEKFGGGETRSDADKILGRLHAVEGKLRELQQHVRNHGRLGEHERLSYIGDEALALFDAATEPARRHYSSRILSLIAGPYDAIDIAKTVRDALEGLITSKIYKQAFVVDGRNDVIDIIATTGTAPSKDEMKKLVEAFQRGCKAPGGAKKVGDRLESESADIRWWDFLPSDVRDKVCNNDAITDGDEKFLRRVLRIGPPRSAETVKIEDKHSTRVDRFFYEACAELSRLAKRSINPCVKPA